MPVGNCNVVTVVGSITHRPVPQMRKIRISLLLGSQVPNTSSCVAPIPVPESLGCLIFFLGPTGNAHFRWSWMKNITQLWLTFLPGACAETDQTRARTIGRSIAKTSRGPIFPAASPTVNTLSPPR
ncbi:hypothetical protein Mapa_001104 [Marchantia paleacea]|nr:hypothetical protein Mapa_001104 [Marchantia paleacea]